jgi:hypothetical protein
MECRHWATDEPTTTQELASAEMTAILLDHAMTRWLVRNREVGRTIPIDGGRNRYWVAASIPTKARQTLGNMHHVQIPHFTRSVIARPYLLCRLM